ncbi:MAG: arylsulfatase [Verrucomicrobiota bacterium]
MKHIFILFLIAGFAAIASAKQVPNLVYILVDDMGYGDVSSLNLGSKIQTPHIDRLAKEGMIFTDAHSSSSVCTPTRYNVLTGRYNWRTHLKSGVLYGYGQPLIKEDRLTFATLYQQQGYATAMIGKWHLGMGLPFADKTGKNKPIDWSKRIERTPTSNGFNYFWGHGASLDMPPYVYIENNHYTSTDVRMTKPGKEVPKGALFRMGPIADDFDPYRTLDEFCDRAATYILKADAKKPFCLYVPLTSPHTPILPTEEWQGQSGLNSYADFCMQTDAGVGRILDALDVKGIAENTIVIFTADNGCSRRADINGLQEMGHYPSYIYRGSKADIWEGGLRVPHLVRWPQEIEAGTRSDRLTLLGDIFATVAEILDYELPENAGEDSISFLAALKGKEHADNRDHLVSHSVSGLFAIRKGKWKLLFCAGSGGWTSPNEKEAAKQALPKYQLYDLEADPGETNNLIASHPEVEKELTALITDIIAQGRSTPGVPQDNHEGRNRWKQTVWMNN